MNWPNKHAISTRRFRPKSRNSVLDYAQLEPRQLLASIDVIAAGVTGEEQVSLQINQLTVQTWNNLGGDAFQNEFVTLNYNSAGDVSPDEIRIRFNNDLYDPASGIDRGVRVDAIVIDGQRFESESPIVFSTGTWRPATYTS